MSHFRNTCPACGRVSQCKCMGPRTETRNPCPGCKVVTFSAGGFQVPIYNAVEEDIQAALNRHWDERGVSARWLLLGWQRWLQLGWLIRKGEGEPLRASHYMSIEIVVDEVNPLVVRALPPLAALRFGGAG